MTSAAASSKVILKLKENEKNKNRKFKGNWKKNLTTGKKQEARETNQDVEWIFSIDVFAESQWENKEA